MAAQAVPSERRALGYREPEVPLAACLKKLVPSKFKEGR